MAIHRQISEFKDLNRRLKFKRAARRLPLPWGGSSVSSTIFMGISVILIAASTFRPAAFEGARNVTADIFAPALSTVGMPFQQVTMFLHNVTNLAQLQADKSRLEEENMRLREWYQTALLLDSENRSLRELLNLQVDSSYSHVSARILADSGNAYVKSLLVAAGADEGLIKGAAVVAGEGLVGRVVEVGEETSRIILVNDVNSRVPVVVEDSGQHAIMAGMNEQNPRLIHIPEDTTINEGARVVTSGYGGVYPQGLPVGRVVANENGGLEVVLFSDFNTLQIVRVLLREK
ncbi:MAG: rod shape-determining protein MreC [Alcanivorax sp.]